MDIKKESEQQLGTMQKNFKMLREKRNWSIKKLSEITGISEKILEDIESGRDFDVYYLFELCSLYNIKPHKIFLTIKGLNS